MSAAFYKRRMTFIIVLILSMGLVLMPSGNAYAQGSKKVGTLKFQVPDDWPVEKRGGLMTPVPTEEYVSIKFKEIAEEFQIIKDDFAEKFEELGKGLKEIENDVAGEIKKRQSSSDISGGQDLTNVLSNIDLLKSELARLDRKITNKVKDMQADFEKINSQVELINKNLDDLQTQIYRLEEKVDYFQGDRSY